MTTETAHHPYVETTSSIRVSVKPELIRERTAPSQGMYSFAYHVKIENLSDVNVQLIERHWIVMSGGRQIGEVVGPGVIGQQPFLEPRAKHQANELLPIAGMRLEGRLPFP